MVYEREVEVAKKLALEAGHKILEIYNNEKLDITKKGDDSPLTQADIAANDSILAGIKKEFPEHGILTEEAEDNKQRLNKDFVWIIDPLDGTKEFISRNGEFTINIALTHDGDPIIGVIYIPIKEELFFAVKGQGAFYQKKDNAQSIRVSSRAIIQDMILMISRSHATQKELDLIQKNKFAEVKRAGSSLKGCLVAKGEADIYFRFGPTMEWDVCAMDCIVREAGGLMTDLEGKFLKYNKVEPEIKGFIVSNKTIHNTLLQVAKNG